MYFKYDNVNQSLTIENHNTVELMYFYHACVLIPNLISYRNN